MAKLVFDDEQAAPARKLVFADDAAAPPSAISPVESATMGAAQGGTLGFADEGAAGVHALQKAAQDFFHGKVDPAALMKYYKTVRDQYRDKFHKAEEENPKSYGAGEFAGTVATNFIPGMEATTIPKMAALAGLQGLGHSEKEDLTGMATDTAMGAAAGATGGAIAKGATAMVNPSFWEDLAQNRGLKALGFTKRFLSDDARRAEAKKVAQTMLDEGVITPTAGADDMAARAEALSRKSGARIGSFLKGMEPGMEASDIAVGEYGLDPQKAIQAINELRPAERGGHNETIHAALDKAIETIKGYGDGPIPWEKANKLKGLLQDVAKFNSNTENLTLGANQLAAGRFKGVLDDSLESAAKDMGQTPGFEDFLKNKKIYGAAERAGDALNNRLSSEMGNRSLGLTDFLTAGAGIAAGNPAEAATLLGVKKVGDIYGNQAMASGANQAAKGTRWVADKIPELLKMNPERFGKYAQVLGRAAQAGGEAVGLRHWLLMNNDPEYRKMIRQMEEQPE